MAQKEKDRKASQRPKPRAPRLPKRLLNLTDSVVVQRQARLLEEMEVRGVEGLIVSHLPNIFYLTGFFGSAGLAFFSARSRILWVDGRYGIQAREQAKGVRVVVAPGNPFAALVQRLNGNRRVRIGFESDRFSHAQYLHLRRNVKNFTQLIPVVGIVEKLRQIKDKWEVDAIRRACWLTVKIFEEIRDVIHPGIREKNLAAEIDFRLRSEGSEGTAFETIVVSGPRTALPHGLPSEKRIRKKDLVLIDLGAILNHYCADLTRTLFLGKPDSETCRIYEQVRDAQQRAVESVLPGARGEQVDHAARAVLKRGKLDRCFTHSTGHGVGLEIHEAPRLARNAKACLCPGSVVTVEPGVYRDGWGGIRIEDTVLVGTKGPEILTPADKGNWVIG